MVMFTDDEQQHKTTFLIIRALSGQSKRLGGDSTMVGGNSKSLGGNSKARMVMVGTNVTNKMCAAKRIGITGLEGKIGTVRKILRMTSDNLLGP